MRCDYSVRGICQINSKLCKKKITETIKTKPTNNSAQMNFEKKTTVNEFILETNVSIFCSLFTRFFYMTVSLIWVNLHKFAITRRYDLLLLLLLRS